VLPSVQVSLQLRGRVERLIAHRAPEKRVAHDRRLVLVLLGHHVRVQLRLAVATQPAEVAREGRGGGGDGVRRGRRVQRVQGRVVDDVGR